MHCLMLLSSRRWVFALSASVRGRVSEFRDAAVPGLCHLGTKESLPPLTHSQSGARRMVCVGGLRHQCTRQSN